MDSALAANADAGYCLVFFKIALLFSTLGYIVFPLSIQFQAIRYSKTYRKIAVSIRKTSTQLLEILDDAKIT